MTDRVPPGVEHLTDLRSIENSSRSTHPLHSLPTPIDVSSTGEKHSFGAEVTPLMVSKHRVSHDNAARANRLPPPPQQRFVSDSIDAKNRINSFQIKPVDRVASRPIGAPLAGQLLAHSSTTQPSVFITFDPVSGSKQVWQCPTQIGQGSFSKVYLCLDKHTVVKVTDVEEQDEDTRLRLEASLVRELELLQELSHPNIVRLLGYSSDIDQHLVTMALPYYSGGDMYQFVNKHRPEMKLGLIRSIFANIVAALRYMHHQNVCHRDIKLENILLSSNNLLSSDHWQGNIAALSDFGLAKNIDPANPLLTTRCGSEDYVSPELLLSLKYDGKQNDCWSLGVLLYAILEARLPFDPPPTTRGRQSRSSHRIATINWSWYQLKDTDVLNGEDYSGPKEIVNHLLVKCTKRWTIDDVSKHQWCV